MGVLVLLTFGGGGGGLMQNGESPDFRSPEVGRYETCRKVENFLFVYFMFCFVSDELYSYLLKK